VILTPARSRRLLLIGLATALAAQAQAQSAPPEDAAAEPIISDSQFDEALPALDDALDAPLEPVDAVTDAPVPDDAALDEPLPPIATFDVEPPAAAVTEQAAEQAPEIRYTVAIEGLKDIGLQGRFRDLSALEDGDGEAENGAVVAARAKEDEALALRLLQSEGYYDALVSSVVQPVAGQAGRVSATLSVSPGTQYKMGDIRITGPDTVPPGLAREALTVKPGDPVNAAAIEGAEANISLMLPRRGYPFVTLGRRDIVLDDATYLGDYTLPVDPGPRASFGGFTTTGDLAFDADHVETLSRFERGELYNSLMVDDLREAMVATGLLASVAVEPVRTGEIAPDGTEYVDLQVTQDAGPPRTLAASAGYATGQGFRLEGSWTHRNLFPPEGALIVEGVGGTQEQSLGVTFRRQNAGKRDRTVFLNARVAHENFDAYEAYTTQLSGRISRDSTPIWQKKWTWAYGFELIASREDPIDPTRDQRDRGTYFIAALPGQLGYDASNSLLDPTSGFRVLGRLSPEISQRGSSNSQYLRGLIEGSAYYPVQDNLVIAGRVRFGTIVNASRDEIAPSRRLYAGGGGSVRGFGYQQLGPKDVNNDPIGGRSLAEFALEARYRFGNFGIVPFIDAGQVYDSTLPQFSDIRFGAGIGGRFYTNFGPVRVDVATPLGRRPGEAKVALYISIGQAF
jgi:translocation and assembly module TamA